MNLKNNIDQGIPIATSLQNISKNEQDPAARREDKHRIVVISMLAIGIAVAISFIAKFLVSLINLVTNISFFSKLSATPASPQHNALGLLVIVIPAVGGIIVGLMALYGSKAIRGHGIPEAMEQILTNHSKIKPTITYLKPISSAIAIGTGGPFGAEGPIIATGGALGSTIGQLLKISHYERKVLLAAGATAGMSAIFSSPVAAIFLAIELLLFEFSAGSIIPVALACITGAAGHHFLFEPGPVFAIAEHLASPGNEALFIYSICGVLIGLISVGVTKIVYLIEDAFEKLPIHWMWWPAIGGLFVGVIGYFNPRTLGVGYNNITDVLAASMPLQVVVMLCLMKFASWAVALGSGTSGGTLAPLLTIGGATGAIMGVMAQRLFPGAGISVSMAALVGMSAMFAGASRALLTSIIFALETTGQVNALVPLLAACTIAYFISIYLMENTIMTEKIARRGVRTPVSYKPDILDQLTVQQVIDKDPLILEFDTTVGDAKKWINQHIGFKAKHLIVLDDKGYFKGLVPTSVLGQKDVNETDRLSSFTTTNGGFVRMEDELKTAVLKMANDKQDVLPVLGNNNYICGILEYANLLKAYKLEAANHLSGRPIISLKLRSLKLLVRGQRIIQTSKGRQ